MKRILAIAGLTWKSAFRYRLFWILAALLAGAVVGLPLLLKDDGTAKGLTQILLTYTLSAVAALLGMATLWLSCGTLARDVEECQIQMVTVKPISRWQVWLGKWLGILGLNAMLVWPCLERPSLFCCNGAPAISLPMSKRCCGMKFLWARFASIKEPVPDFGPQIEQNLRQWINKYTRTSGNPPTPSETAEMRNQITEQIKAMNTDVPPGVRRRWGIDMHTLPERTRDDTFQVRVKFHAANPNPARPMTLTGALALRIRPGR